MRTLIVGFMTFVLSMVFVWLCCAFVTGVANPFLWTGPGRFAFLFFGFSFSLFPTIAMCCWFEESVISRK